MVRHPRVGFYGLVAVGLCINSTGCIFLGAYPVVQDVPGPVRGIRVIDSQSKEDISDAKVSFNAEWGGINQFESITEVIREEYDTQEKIWHAGSVLLHADTKQSGLLTRSHDGIFTVGLHRKFMPGIGFAAIGFGDGPGYMGPFGKKHGEMGYVAVVTAWAPEYKPLQFRYHAPLFAEFQCRNGEFDPRTGILSIALCRSEKQQNPAESLAEPIWKSDASAATRSDLAFSQSGSARVVVSPPESPYPGRKRLEQAVIVTNATNHAVFVFGHSLDHVFVEVATRDPLKDEWSSLGLGYCGTGAKLYPLAPGDSFLATIRLPIEFADREYKVAVDLYSGDGQQVDYGLDGSRSVKVVSRPMRLEELDNN